MHQILSVPSLQGSLHHTPIGKHNVHQFTVTSWPAIGHGQQQAWFDARL
jgi:hypothetical protein